MQKPQELAMMAAEAAKEKLAKDLRLLQVSHLTVVSDYFLIVTANSQPQMQAIADAVEKTLIEQGESIKRQIGLREGRWAVLDFGFLMLHIFRQEERDFYKLDRLWADGSNEIIIPEAVAAE